MSFGDYLLGALLYTALAAIIPAIATLRIAWGHYNDSRATRKKVEAAWGAVLVSLGVSAHVVSELVYKSSRLLQIWAGVNVNSSGDIPPVYYAGFVFNINLILAVALPLAALLGIASLSFAVHYLNQTRTWYKKLYWSGHAVFFAVFVLL